MPINQIVFRPWMNNFSINWPNVKWDSIHFQSMWLFLYFHPKDSRLDDQRAVLIPIHNHRPISPQSKSTSVDIPSKTLPDDDFFSLLNRLQSRRIDQQRTCLPPTSTSSVTSPSTSSSSSSSSKRSRANPQWWSSTWPFPLLFALSL